MCAVALPCGEEPPLPTVRFFAAVSESFCEEGSTHSYALLPSFLPQGEHFAVNRLLTKDFSRSGRQTVSGVMRSYLHTLKNMCFRSPCHQLLTRSLRRRGSSTDPRGRWRGIHQKSRNRISSPTSQCRNGHTSTIGTDSSCGKG